MELLPLLLTLTGVHWLTMASPGPNWLLVTSTAMSGRPRESAATVAGLATAGMIWSASVAFGLSALFTWLPWLQVALTVAGGLWLIRLGWRLWQRPGEQHAVLLPPVPLAVAYRRGLVTNLTNPKSLAYFASVFVLFTQPGTPEWVLVAAVAIVVVSSTMFHGGLAWLFSRPRPKRLHARLRRSLDRVTGSVMAAFGLHLLAGLRHRF